MNRNQLIAIVVMVVAAYAYLSGGETLAVDPGNMPQQMVTNCGAPGNPNSVQRVRWMVCMSAESVRQDTAAGR